MSWILGWVWFLIMGGIIGWVASLVTNRDAAMGTGWNVVVGILGSVIGNGVFGFLLPGNEMGAWPPDIGGIISALIGAVVLLGGLNFFQRGNIRG